MSTQRAPQRYTFGPLEHHGLLGRLRGGQVLVWTVALVTAIAALDSAPNAAGVMVAVGVAIAGAALTGVPIATRGADEWLPLLAAFALRSLRGKTRHRSSAPSHGVLASTAHWRPEGPRGVPPHTLADVEIVSLPYRDRALGALCEQRGRLWTTVLACRVHAFALLDAEAQERRLARWGLALGGAAGGPVRRIQWVQRTVPAQGDELARWLHDQRDPTVPLRGTPLIDSYLELLAGSAQVAQEHEILIAVQIDARRVRQHGQAACSAALIEQAQRLAERLRAAEIEVMGALSAGQLSSVLRTAFDPYARAELAALAAADQDRDGLREPAAWPLAARESWDRYRSDGAEHATFWISGWPRVEVPPMFMDALLGRSRSVRTVAVCFEPIPPQRSTREVEAAITRDRADRELRQRIGQTETARQRQAREATLRREAELACGHSELRLAGFVTVSGRDSTELQRGCAEVLEHAAMARLELARMYGQQAEAFTFTLPLCRGLR
jgi:hypothetical protein